MPDYVRIPFDGPYSGEVVVEVCQLHFGGYVCNACATVGMSIIVSDIPSERIKHVGLKCEVCDFSESAGAIDVSQTAQSILGIKKWTKLAEQNSTEGDDRWDRI